jgi:hypothetical protein
LVASGLSLLLAACGASNDEVAAGSGGQGAAGSAGAAGAAGASAGGAGGNTASLSDKAEQYLVGRFDSSQDSLDNPSHFAISLVICRVDAPELGERVLYVEQAKLDQLASPYRQRLYVVEPGMEPNQEVRSRVFELVHAGAFVGLCDQANVEHVAASAADEKAGCVVELTLDAATDTFQGGTQGKGCPSALAGAAYATSEVTLNQKELRSWDRGFDPSDTQVWGATDGPYVFARTSPLSP